MENRDLASEMKDRAEMLQIVGAMAALQYQMSFPTYEGMIAALRNAQYLASSEIQGAINQSGGQAWCSWRRRFAVSSPVRPPLSS